MKITTLRALATATSSASTPTIKWGILSAGKISSDFCKAIAITPEAECVGVAARSASKAADFAKLHDIPHYGTYEELLERDDIDVYYVGSIADQHEKMAKMCLLAGKATVVEKPLTLSAEDSVELVQLAREKNLFLV